MIKAWTYKNSILLMLFLAVSLPPRVGQAERLSLSSWVLPLTINDDNTEVRYTYHAMGREKSGRSRGIQGRAWLANSDLRSVKAQITVPSPDLSAVGNDLLGAFGNLLKGAQLPPVHVSIDRIANLCLPKDIAPGRDCLAKLEGRAQFGSLTRELSLPVRIRRKQDSFQVHGEGQLDSAAGAQSVAMANVIDSATFTFTLNLPS